MVYKFKLVSDEVSNFSREIEVGSDNTFLQLRNAILDSVGYTKNDLDSFFLCDEDWQRQEEVALEDMGTSSDQDLWIMADTTLSELIEDEGQKVAFVFDYMTERSFFMELKEIIPGRSLKEPICTFKKGNAPRQSVDLEEFTNNIDREAARQAARMATDIDDDFYGDSAYNEDEISDGYDDLSFN